MSEPLNIDWLVGDMIGILSENQLELPDILRELEGEGHTQVVTVRSWPFTMAWRLLDSSLRNFMVRAAKESGISPRDLFALTEFCVYELAHGRRVPIWFEDARVRESVTVHLSRLFADGEADLEGFLAYAMATQRDRFAELPPEPPRHTDCRFCHEGICCGDLVCHATSLESAIGIVRDGRILSACRAFGISPKEAARDPRNAAGDPPDYFEYVMYGPGNCTALDRLVFERSLDHNPSWEEFEAAFQPAVRFFFRADHLRTHPRLTFDGIHEKIRDELALDPWLLLMVVPEGMNESGELIELAHRELPTQKVASFSFEGVHFRDWARMVYREAQSRSHRQTHHRPDMV